MVLRGDREVDLVRVAVLGVGEDEHEDEVLALVVRPGEPDRRAILGLELVGGAVMTNTRGPYREEFWTGTELGDKE